MNFHFSHGQIVSLHLIKTLPHDCRLAVSPDPRRPSSSTSCAHATTMDNSTNSTNGTFEGNGTGNGTFGGDFQATPKSFWTNLLLPTLYLTILIGSLYTFSSLYRTRQLSKAARLEPWFPMHKTRDIYLSLLHIDPSDGGDDEKKLKKVPDSVLRAALLRRAVEDIQRIVQIRGAKPALQTLLQRGSVGDELWQRFLRAEKDIEEEIKDVVSEVSNAEAVPIMALSRD